jgi:hypothetical protein
MRPAHGLVARAEDAPISGAIADIAIHLQITELATRMKDLRRCEHEGE